MTEKEEQRVCIKFCQRLGKTSTETFEMLRMAFGDEAMSRARTFEWFRRFEEGRTTVESDERSGRPTSSRNAENIEAVRQLVKEDRRLTVRELSDDLGISIGSCHMILTEDLGMRRVAAKFVPRLLTADQKEARLAAATDLLECADSDPRFLDRIITGDETWVYGYDPETKVQSSVWKSPSSPRPKKARQSRSKTKVLLTVFFDSDGVVHHEYAPPGQTVNTDYYLRVLRNLRDAVRRKRPEKWSTGNWELHHDNAPAHSAQRVQEFLTKHGIPQVRQPPYSPDLAPCDFFLFPTLKKTLKGRRFEDLESIRTNATEKLRHFTETDFQSCFRQWKVRWTKCVQSQGEYFEGD